MRKRTIIFLADKIFWFLIATIPILSYLCFLIGQGSTSSISGLSYFSAWYDSNSFGIPATSVVYDTLNQIFGSAGLFPLFSNTAVIKLLSWFISVEIIHLAVDVVLFIPRLAHKWLSAFNRTED